MCVAQWRGRFEPRLFIRNLSYFFKYSVTASVLLGGSLHAEPLSFAAALALAEQQAPELRQQAAEIEAARYSEVAAGRLPDPRLTFGINNLPVTGVDSWRVDRDAMTMQTVGVMQELPNGRKRQAERDVAAARLAQTQAQREVQLRAVRREAALAWLKRFYLEKQVALLDALGRENQLFADAVQAKLLAGPGAAADVIAPRQEAADLADRRDELSAAIVQANAELRRWVGAAADQPLSGAVPELDIDPHHLRGRVHTHPELATYAPLLQAADAEVRAAEAMKRPDWGVEVMYGRRGAAFDDMVSLQFSVGLPLFTGTRQEPQIAARRQARLRISAERDAMLREHIVSLDAALAEHEVLDKQLERLRSVRLPLARQKVDLQLAGYQGGTGDLNAVLLARRELIDTELKQLALEQQLLSSAAVLHFTYGEDAQ